jgi:hypothetical protein
MMISDVGLYMNMKFNNRNYVAPAEAHCSP